MAPVGWGIAGTGWVARDYVAPAILASANGRLLALHDRDRAALDAMPPSQAASTTDLDAFLATPGLEAIYVATPNHAHRALVEAAAAKGLAVLCEKPMAASVADAEAMVAACRRGGVRYATAFDQRFHPAHLHATGLIRAGALGRVIAVRIVYACWLPPGWSADNWRVDRNRAGGGALIDLAPHGLDLSAMLLDDPIADVVAIGQARVHDYADASVEDGALLMARSEGGVLVQAHVAYNCPDALPRRRLEVVGTAAQLTAIDTMGQTAGGTLTLTDAATGGACRIEVPHGDRSPFVNQVEAFAAHVRGAGFPSSPQADLHLMRLVAKAQEDARLSIAPRPIASRPVAPRRAAVA